jgi:hypothetical protein
VIQGVCRKGKGLKREKEGGENWFVVGMIE